MQQESRIKNTIRNTYIGFGSYILISILGFVSRTVFIKVLGVDYLGINGLFSNILSLLALSDLGMNVVMQYSLYKPLAENDEEKITLLINYFQKIYRGIAFAILILGLLLIPFLPFIVHNTNLPDDEVIIFYILLLMNSVCSYFVVSKTTLIRADQKLYIIQFITALFTIFTKIAEIILLVTVQNYTVLLVSQICFTLATNITLSVIADKRYPFLKSTVKSGIPKEFKTQLIGNIKSTFLYKVGATVINSTTSIIISILLGTVIVGYYSNYLMIITMVNAVISIFIQSITASVGNYFVTHNANERFSLFGLLLLSFYMIAGFCSCCYLSVFSDFIEIWIGEEYILPNSFLYALVFTNYVAFILNPVWMTREAGGTFYAIRYIMIYTAIINVILSVVLGKKFGLAGIIAATGFAKLLTLFWYEPKILCAQIFKIKTKVYWKKVLKFLIPSVFSVAFGLIIRDLFKPSIFNIMLKIVLSGVCTVTCFLLAIHNTEEGKQLYSRLQPIFHKFKLKK